MSQRLPDHQSTESTHRDNGIDASYATRLIQSRHSVSQLGDPAPSPQQLDEAIAMALTAPDHKRLRPWHFMVVESHQRTEFGQWLAQCLSQDDPTISPSVLIKVAQQPLRAPLIVIAVMKYRDQDKVSRTEQLLSCGAAVQNLLLTLHAQGFSTIWRTGAVAQSQAVKCGLGLDDQDEIAGLIYIGSAVEACPERIHVPVSQFSSRWR